MARQEREDAEEALNAADDDDDDGVFYGARMSQPVQDAVRASSGAEAAVAARLPRPTEEEQAELAGLHEQLAAAADAGADAVGAAAAAAAAAALQAAVNASYDSSLL